MLARSESGWGLHSARFVWANLHARDALHDLVLLQRAPSSDEAPIES